MAEDSLISLVAKLADRSSSDVVVGIGDDAAVINVPDGQSLVSCTDTLVNGVHFPIGTSAYSIGHKSLAVNLSDIAAMAAIPRWAQLSMTLPAYDKTWVTEFLQGFLALADRYEVILVGGDTSAGPLSITVQVMGVAEEKNLLHRGTAAAGDLLAVTGWLGDAALALRMLQKGKSVQPELLQKLNLPEPRLGFSRILSGVASSSIDLSDGLLLDLGRLLEQGKCGAKINLGDLPGSSFLDCLPVSERQELQVSGGDDYELCFSVSPEKLGKLTEAAANISVPFSIIGSVTGSGGVRCYDQAGKLKDFARLGFQHFE